MLPQRPRILLSNDDGVEAPGLARLEEIAATLSDDIWVVAPSDEQSGASRKMSFTEPVLIQELGPRRFSVRGTPSDAVFLAVHGLIDGKKPDLVLSGVNRGQNLAEDISVSGTVAAAIQGMALGIPSVALSQSMGNYFGPQPPLYETAVFHAPPLLKRLLQEGWPQNVLININFPACAPGEVEGVSVTRQGWRDQWQTVAERREDLRGRFYYWIGFHGSQSNPAEGDDLWAVQHNRVSVTPLHVDFTHEPTRERLAVALSGLTAGGES